MAVIWLFFPQVSLAVVPSAIFSSFHTLTYARTQLIGAISPPINSARDTASERLKKFVGIITRNSYNSGMMAASFIELGLWVRILISVLLFQKDSWVLLCAYSAFLRARFGKSEFLRNAAGRLRVCMDDLFEKESRLPVVKRAWNSVKDVVRQVVETTDVDSYKLVADSADGPKQTD